MPVVQKKDVPKDLAGFRAHALKTFLANTENSRLDTVMIDLGYTVEEIQAARDAGKVKLVYTVTLLTNRRDERAGRDYLPSIRDAARNYLGVQRGETVEVEFQFDPQAPAAA